MSNVEDDFFDNRCALDEEMGGSGNSPSSSNPINKSRIGWLIGGTAAFLLIIGLSIGLTGNNGSDELAAAVPAANSASVPTNGSVSDSDNNISPDDSNDVSDLFDLAETLGDAALLNWPEDIEITGTSSPTPAPSISPTPAPFTSDPTMNPSASPSAQPTSSPTSSPSNQPSALPSKAPTLAPTKSPTNEPTKSPSASPTNSPTPEPTNQPTKSPSASPFASPTKSPTQQPTSEPSKQPSPDPTSKPTALPTQKLVTDSPTNPFFFGEEFVTHEELGIEVSRGLNVRLIAQTGEKVQYANGEESKEDYHTKSDAAGIIPMDPNNPLESGYVYLANSEEEDGGGGVYGIYFDKDGNTTEYKSLLTKTTDNCGGGLTPWNTFLSCEEYEGGQCWEIDPINEQAKVTKLGGKDGGRFESVAVDNRNPEQPVFFTTEDHERGALRRFLANGKGWGVLHTDGESDFLNIINDNEFEWTTDEETARDSAQKYFRNSEGIQFHEGKLYFMAKKDFKMLILDLEDMTYVTETTGKKFYGEGSFENQPDQNMFGPTRKYIYFTEDGGTPGVFARYGNDGTYFTLFQAIKGGIYDDDETVGIALSPDHRRFYAGIQDYGVIFEFTREDGLPFE